MAARYLAVVLVLGLAGCAPTRLTFQRVDGGPVAPAELNQALAVCNAEGRKAELSAVISPSNSALDEIAIGCMAGRGYAVLR